MAQDTRLKLRALCSQPRTGYLLVCSRLRARRATALRAAGKSSKGAQSATRTASESRPAPDTPAENSSPSSLPSVGTAELDELLPKRDRGDLLCTRPRTYVSTVLYALSDALPAKFRIMPVEQPGEPVIAFDPLRDGPLRYLGYANELGEAFAAWLPAGGVPFSYVVAISYVLVDTFDKSHMALIQAGEDLASQTSSEVNVSRLTSLLSFEKGLDTLVWQLLASVICPGYTIHIAVAIVHRLLERLESLTAVQQTLHQTAISAHFNPEVIQLLLNKTIPTSCGLLAIPFIVHPIDNAIHALLDSTLRPAMRKYICSNGQGRLAKLDMCSDDGDASHNGHS